MADRGGGGWVVSWWWIEVVMADQGGDGWVFCLWWWLDFLFILVVGFFVYGGG